MEIAEIELHCSSGFTLRAEKSNLVILAKRTEETIPISKIQSFSLKEPGAIKPGMIVFKTAQAASSGVNLGLGVGVALGAEKTFFFSKPETENALRLRDYVANYESSQSSTGAVVSVVDEIRGLKGLLDDGIITSEEFDAKKAQLLGL